MKVFQGQAPRPLGPSTGSPRPCFVRNNGTAPDNRRRSSIPSSVPPETSRRFDALKVRKGQDRRLSARLPPSRCSQGSGAGCPAMPDIPLAGSEARSRRPAIAADGCAGRPVAGSGFSGCRPRGPAGSGLAAPLPSSPGRPAALVPGSWAYPHPLRNGLGRVRRRPVKRRGGQFSLQILSRIFDTRD